MINENTEIKKQNYKKEWKRPFILPAFFEEILLLICGGGISFLMFVIFPETINIFMWNKYTMVHKYYSNSDIDNAKNIWHQIYYIASNTDKQIDNLSFCIFALIGILLGLLILFLVWSIFKYSRIERRIVETQSMIQDLKNNKE